MMEGEGVTIQRTSIYNVSMEEARCGAACPDTFLPVLMIGGKCSLFLFRAKAGLAHLRWKTSTSFRRKRGKTQEQPIPPTSRLVIPVEFFHLK